MLTFVADIPIASHCNSGLGKTVPSTTASTDSDVTSSDPVSDAALALAEYVLDGDFSEVLGAGLGAVYSLLPSKPRRKSRMRESR